MINEFSLARIKRIIASFPRQHILVVGDLMVDRFVWGTVSRISPEAPVPVVTVERESVHLGGAGNVVNNLRSLGAHTSVVGVVGNDQWGGVLRKELSDRGTDTAGVVVDEQCVTIQKTRIVAGSQQVVRVDREAPGRFSPVTLQRLSAEITRLLPQVHAVIISDYGKGVIHRHLLSTLLRQAQRLRVPVIVDPKIEHFQMYKRVTCITPNTKEAAEGMFARLPKTDAEVTALGMKILARLKSKSVLITRGELGMSLFERGGRLTHIPTVAQEVFDVTGAGDTVISVFALAHASGATLRMSAYVSNIAGGIVVGKIGTAVASRDEILTWARTLARRHHA